MLQESNRRQKWIPKAHYEQKISVGGQIRQESRKKEFERRQRAQKDKVRHEHGQQEGSVGHTANAFAIVLSRKMKRAKVSIKIKLVIIKSSRCIGHVPKIHDFVPIAWKKQLT